MLEFRNYAPQNSSGRSRTDSGSEFHRLGPETAKHIWPWCAAKGLIGTGRQ